MSQQDIICDEYHCQRNEEGCIAEQHDLFVHSKSWRKPKSLMRLQCLPACHKCKSLTRYWATRIAGWKKSFFASKVGCVTNLTMSAHLPGITLDKHVWEKLCQRLRQDTTVDAVAIKHTKHQCVLAVRELAYKPCILQTQATRFRPLATARMQDRNSAAVAKLPYDLANDHYAKHIDWLRA